VSDYRTNKGDVIRDPYGGDVVVLGVLRPEDLGQFVTGSYRGSSMERCALAGPKPRKELARKDLTPLCPARDGRLKETA
jgi:hypothetical protein